MKSATNAPRGWSFTGREGSPSRASRTRDEPIDTVTPSFARRRAIALTGRPLDAATRADTDGASTTTRRVEPSSLIRSDRAPGGVTTRSPVTRVTRAFTRGHGW